MPSSAQPDRDVMEFDVVVVGGGPAGLSTAIRLKQLRPEASICVVEKSAEIGGHILSGACFDPRALNELIPDWAEKGAPLDVPVTEDEVRLLTKGRSVRVPVMFAPWLHNKGNYIVSLGAVCRWLAEQAEALEIDIFPGFAASDLIDGPGDTVAGVRIGDFGVDHNGDQKQQFTPGMDLMAKTTVLSEGCRGHLGKRVIRRFGLDLGRDPQHYGIGLKEIWNVQPENHRQGLILHSIGWPAAKGVVSGSFMYHGANNQVYVGYVVPLSYANPHLQPFAEFQQWKTHPSIARTLQGGERVAYGARALIKGGPQSRPSMVFPGGLLIGDDAGTLNFARIKGSHTAMKSGMLAAEAIAAHQQDGGSLTPYDHSFETSWAGQELRKFRNFGALVKSFGGILGGGAFLSEQIISFGKGLGTLRDSKPDHATLKAASDCPVIQYPKPDGKISFDRLSSVFLSATNHEEDQPCHLTLADPETPIRDNLPLYGEPARHYCPAGVYEVVTDKDSSQFVINAQNCVHCKTCDIKDPAQNITWVTPEGGGGPNYPNM